MRAPDGILDAPTAGAAEGALADRVSVEMAGFRPVAILLNGMKYAYDRPSDTYILIVNDRILGKDAKGGRLRGGDIPYLVERGVIEVLPETGIDDDCCAGTPEVGCRVGTTGCD